MIDQHASAARVRFADRSEWAPDAISMRTMVRAAHRIGIVLLFVGITGLASVGYFLHLQADGGLAFDFSGTIWNPLHDALRGVNPYPAAERAQVDIGNPSVYPPLAFLAAAPLIVLPYPVAATVWIFALAAGVVVSLLIVGVRDWRCHALALTSFPVVHGLAFANVTLALLPLAAAAWRLRRQQSAAGLAIGLAVAAKLFLWPLALWLIVTRRLRAVVSAVLVAAILLLLSWSAIGFDGFRSYPRLLHVATDVFAAHSVSIGALVIAGGGSVRAAELAVAVIGVVSIAAAIALARTRGRRVSDAGAFAIATVAGLLTSPIVWPHYYALLIVAVAVLRPRFDATWLLFPLTWVFALAIPGARLGPANGPSRVPEEIWRFLHGGTPIWQTFCYLAVAAAVGVVALRHRRRVGAIA